MDTVTDPTEVDTVVVPTGVDTVAVPTIVTTTTVRPSKSGLSAEPCDGPSVPTIVLGALTRVEKGVGVRSVPEETLTHSSLWGHRRTRWAVGPGWCRRPYTSSLPFSPGGPLPDARPRMQSTEQKTPERKGSGTG